MNTNNITVLSSGLKRGVFALTAFSTMAYAGELPAEESGTSIKLEEIVVTARKREERLQDVPMSVSAFSSNFIEAAGIENINDVAALTPNFDIRDDQQPGVFTLSVRGVSNLRNGDAPVAFVVDDVTISDPNAFTRDLFDIERIEILKGPQGALYGQNSIGGAINIITKKPTNEITGRIKAGFAEGNETRLSGSVSGPLVEDKVLFRLAASYRDTDGLIKNTLTGTDADWYEEVSVLGKLMINLNDNASLDLRASMSETDAGAGYYYNASPGFFNQPVGSFMDDRENFSDREVYDIAGKLTWETDFATITAIASYDEGEQYIDEGLDWLPISVFEINQRIGTQTRTAELRLASNDESPMQWLVTGFYQQQDRDFESNFFFNINSPLDLFGTGMVGDGNPATKFLIQFPTTILDQERTSYALAGQADYDLNDVLALSVALRYDHVEKNELRPGIDERNRDFDMFQPRVSLSYKPTEDLTVYASYSRGFRAGGLNPAPTFGDDYNNEKTSTFELGVKSRGADKRLTANAAIFYTDYTDQQFQAFDLQTASNNIVNADESRLWGLEAEVAYLASESLMIGGAIGYTKGTIEEFGAFTQPLLVDPEALDGNKLPNTPEYTVNLFAEYTQPIGDALDLVFRADYRRNGEVYWDPDNANQQDAVDLVDLRITLESEKWAVSAYAENVTDEHYEVFRFGWVWNGVPTGSDTYWPNQPQKFGIEARYNF